MRRTGDFCGRLIRIGAIVVWYTIPPVSSAEERPALPSSPSMHLDPQLDGQVEFAGLVYDLRDQTVHSLPKRLAVDPETARIEGEMGAEWADVQQRMDYAWVGAQRENYPYRTAVRTCTKQASGGYCIGSGVMISPIHVLTAGHVAAPGPGCTGAAFPSGIDVWPALWDGLDIATGNHEPEPFEESPFGKSQGIFLHVPTPWLNQGDSRFDIAVVTLDRPIGALTGWVGRLFEGNDYLSGLVCRSNDFFTTTSFTMNSFPGGYNQMRSWSGTFDYLGPWISFDQGFFAYFLHSNPPEHAIGGESGSGIFSYVNGTPFASSILIAHTGGGLADAFCYVSGDIHNVALRIDQAKFDFISASIALPAAFDAVPLNVRVGEMTLPKLGPSSACFPTGQPSFLDVTARQPLPPISMWIANRSSAS